MLLVDRKGKNNLCFKTPWDSVTRVPKHGASEHCPAGDDRLPVCSGVTRSHDVESHVRGTPQAGSRDQATVLQVHTVAPCLEASQPLIKLGQTAFSRSYSCRLYDHLVGIILSVVFLMLCIVAKPQTIHPTAKRVLTSE